MKILDVPQSGSVAGVTSSRNRFGQYRRTRAVPVNPNTSRQQDARNRLSDFSAGWRALTDVQREAWEAYALEHPVTDSLGQSNTLTGAQVYVGINSLLATAALAAVSTPPAGAAPDAPVLDVSSTDTDSFTLDVTPDPVTAGHALIVESSPPLSAGRSFNADFRVLEVAAAASSGTVDDVMLAARWGTLAVGQKFFFRARLVKANGAVSAFGATSAVLTLAP
jgi:hypothetical protein